MNEKNTGVGLKTNPTPTLHPPTPFNTNEKPTLHPFTL